ncbi:MAG TPA: hypothetical protein DD735_07755 [Clostridiales bacterium]|nr:hypothetical protein [Clostridiales bacterium]
MVNWMVAAKAAKYIKDKNPQTMIGERTIRMLTKNGFPCLKIDSRWLINVDTFEEDLINYSKRQAEEEAKILKCRIKRAY